MGDTRDVSDEEWKQKLTPEQYHVLREKGTEAPFSGDLLENKETGEYRCAACGEVIFKSGGKYESNTPGLAGWPSFSEVSGSGKVELVPDDSLGMHRTEVICKTCGSHLVICSTTLIRLPANTIASTPAPLISRSNS